ncbi:hypothetical protein [uncultured Mediterranean phage uvDeep-CGR2-KM18-C269]|nr:hypothetical protein [uncultured Mediterranean phage uvDeep-CGR2-KM18-C269]
MLGIGSSLVKGGKAGRTYVRDGLKLYMPYRGADLSKGTQFVGTGSTSFDGDNDYVSVADAANLSFGDGSTDSAFSISVWINMDDATSFPIATKGIYNSTGEWHFKTDTDDKLYFALFDESVADTYEIAYTTAVLTAYEGSWVHVCGTYNGVGGTSANGGISLYVNGVGVAMTLTGGGTYVAMENLAADVHIGRLGSTYAGGDIKNVAIWNRALTATEVQNVMYKTYAEVSGRLASGLVSWWALDVDYTDSKGSNNGTNYGSTLNTDLYGGDTPVKPRAIDNAPTVQADAIGAGSASFDGTDDYITIADDSTLDIAGDWSISTWIKIDSGMSSYHRVIGKQDPSSNQCNYGIGIATTNKIGAIFNDGSWRTAYSADALVVGQWYHIVGVWDDSEENLHTYIDGSLIATTNVSGGSPSGNDDPITIGTHESTGGEWFDGNICQVGIWSASLTQAQIQSIMEKTFEELTASEKTNLVSYWALDEAEGVTGVLDKVDETLGSELLSNSTFDSNITGWTDISTGSGSIAWNPSGYMEVIGLGLSDRGKAVATATTVVGNVYQVKFTRTNQANPAVYVGTSSSGVQYINGAVTGDCFIATATTVYLTFSEAGTGTQIIDDVSIKQRNGNVGILT